MNKITLKNRLKVARAEKNFSQEELANLRSDPTNNQFN